jgi:hypothetical protein
MAIKTYDPKQVAIYIGPVAISGWVSASVSFEDDSYEHTSGVDGEEMRTKKNDNRATLTLSLNQSSDSNDYLSGLHAADRLTNAGVLPVIIKDNSGRSLVESESGWIKKAADFRREASPQPVEWMLSLSNAIIFHGGHD